MQVEVAETAEATAQATHQLARLTALLPSRGVLFGSAATHAERQQAAVTAAGQHSAQWTGAAKQVRDLRRVASRVKLVNFAASRARRQQAAVTAAGHNSAQ